ncbi:MAG: WD40 repeat domain-containing protein [Ktedonobacteraceae bacterium]|nr:WD40 repeat domain-containing protein [Ktedonobacteraceae bacterium]
MHKQTANLSHQLLFKALSGLVLLLSVVGCAQPGPSQNSHPGPASPPLGSPLFTYNGHSDRVTTVAWSPNGKRIASGSLDKTVQVWDAKVSKEFQVYTYHGHSGSILTVAWSPDSKRVASGSSDKTIQIWDATTGDHRTILRGHTDRVTTVAWSPDGTLLASGSADGTVRIWDVNSGQQKYVYRGHTDAVNVVAWSPDGKRIASGSSDKTVQILASATGQRLFVYRGHTNTVSSLSWSPDGKRIASGSWDKSVQVWDASSGAVAYTYRGYNVEAAKSDQTKGILPDLIFAVAWSHNGKRIAAVTQVYCGDVCDIVVLLDAHNGNYDGSYQTLPMFAIAWSPDDTRLVEGLGLSTARITQAG